MNVQELIIQCIRHAAANVFSTMLGVELGRGERVDRGGDAGTK